MNKYDEDEHDKVRKEEEEARRRDNEAKKTFDMDNRIPVKTEEEEDGDGSTSNNGRYVPPRRVVHIGTLTTGS